METALESSGLEFALYVEATLKTRQDADKLIARVMANREFLIDGLAVTVSD
jgi:hypothetical protein